VCPKVSGLNHNEIDNNNNKDSLRSNTKGYGGKTHLTESQNSDTTAPSGRELCHVQFSLQAASPETFGYTLVHVLFRFRILTSESYESVWTFSRTPWTGDQPDARPLPTQDNTTQKNADTFMPRAGFELSV
jgi:hypothetical protein